MTAIILLPSIMVAVAWGYVNRATGVSLPFLAEPVDVWGWVIKPGPQPLQDILIENYAMWLGLYSLVWVLAYVEPQRRLFAPFKLNKKYPRASLMRTEFFRSARGLLIGSGWQYLVNDLHATGTLPVTASGANPTLSTDVTLLQVAVAALIIYAWGDAHFYWTHRWLHSDWLFKNVHKEHHQSFNPDPWSGLSMHWFESAVYFSSAPMLAPFVPLWFARLMFVGLLVSPLEGHSGFGSFDVEPTCNHYLHHAKFKWNYGSTALWDHIMGTNYPMDRQRRNKKDKPKTDTAAEREAQAQARVCGAVIQEGLEAAATGYQKTH